MPGNTKQLVPIAYRQAHFDAVAWHRPMSVMSVVPVNPGINYAALYASPTLRAQAREQATIGFGNGGTTWDSALTGSFVLNEGGLMVPGMAYGLWRTKQDGNFVVSWHWPRYKVVPSDIAEPIWDKIGPFSVTIALAKRVDVTKQDSGTGDDATVISSIYVYGLYLINDLSAYDFSDPENPQPRQWVFYGISNGVKGWYRASEIENAASHRLLSSAHTNTNPEANPRGCVIVAEGTPAKWTAKRGTAGKIELLKAGAGTANWTVTPVSGAMSVTNAPDGSLMLVGDQARVPPNHFYGKKGGQKGFHKI